MDGLFGNDLGSTEWLGSPMNMNAIGEVKVLLNNYQAQYGRNAGAMVNAVTKSGTKDFHARPCWIRRVLGTIELLSSQPAIPGEDGVGFGDTRYFFQRFRPSRLPISAKVDRSGSVSRNRVGRCARST